MTEKPEPQDRQTCPVCHRSNDCAVSLGRAIEDCWCNSARFDNAALTRITHRLTGNHCVCRACAQLKEEVGNAR